LSIPFQAIPTNDNPLEKLEKSCKTMIYEAFRGRGIWMIISGSLRCHNVLCVAFCSFAGVNPGSGKEKPAEAGWVFCSAPRFTGVSFFRAGIYPGGRKQDRIPYA
jgi:hypothetical protein